MNKTALGVLVGLVIGGAAVWLVAPRPLPGDSPESGAATQPEQKRENPLHFPPAKREAAGIALARPAERTLASEVQAFGRVLDPAPLVGLLAEVEAARAALTASEKELERAKTLFAAGGNASAQTVENAQAAAARDRAALVSAQARLAASWSRDRTQDPAAIVSALEKGATLVRIDILAGDRAAAEVKTARVGLAGTDEWFEAAVLGPAPVADPQLPGAGLLAIVRDHALPVGAALRATVPGTGDATKVLVVPRSAVVYHQGSAWVYVLGEDDTFARKLVATVRRVDADHVALTNGIDAGEQVAIAGAQQLLAAELQTGGAPDED